MSPETKQEEIIGQDNVGAEGTGAEVIKSQAILRPDLALLRECEFPLPQDEARMPSVNFNHGFVDISIITLDNPRAPDYQGAIIALRAKGCIVVADTDSSGDGFNRIKITAPESLFPAAMIDGLRNEFLQRLTSSHASAKSAPFEIDGAAAGC